MAGNRFSTFADRCWSEECWHGPVTGAQGLQSWHGAAALVLFWRVLQSSVSTDSIAWPGVEAACTTYW